MPRDRQPRPSNRTADERPRDWKRTPRAKTNTLRRRNERRAKYTAQGRG